MESCLRWGHLAPTAPDTIGCYPYTHTDPHILTTMPDIFIAGNQAEYMARKVEINGKSVLLIAVPRFSESTSIIKINLKALTCQVISFDTEMGPEWLDR